MFLLLIVPLLLVSVLIHWFLHPLSLRKVSSIDQGRQKHRERVLCSNQSPNSFFFLDTYVFTMTIFDVTFCLWLAKLEKTMLTNSRERSQVSYLQVPLEFWKASDFYPESNNNLPVPQTKPMGYSFNFPLCSCFFRNRCIISIHFLTLAAPNIHLTTLGEWVSA